MSQEEIQNFNPPIHTGINQRGVASLGTRQNK
jgi:hypothetical protein